MVDNIRPPVLYKLRDARFGQRAIKERRLKVARLLDLNDPFDLLSPRLGPEGNALLQVAKRQWHDEFAIICMSANWQNPVVWSHYADAHKGIALGFWTDPSIFLPVQYKTERPVPQGWPRRFTEADLEEIISTKFCDWSYESEYRGTFEFDAHTVGDGEPHFEPFSPQMKLVEVIIGCASDVTADAVREKLGDLRHVKVFKARAHESEFSLDRDEV